MWQNYHFNKWKASQAEWVHCLLLFAFVLGKMNLKLSHTKMYVYCEVQILFFSKCKFVHFFYKHNQECTCLKIDVFEHGFY